jgi:hypothetical protein
MEENRKLKKHGQHLGTSSACSHWGILEVINTTWDIVWAVGYESLSEVVGHVILTRLGDCIPQSHSLCIASVWKYKEKLNRPLPPSRLLSLRPVYTRNKQEFCIKDSGKCQYIL